MKDHTTTITRQRHVRQEALRQQLEAGGHVQHVVDLLGKISNPKSRMKPEMVRRYELTINTKLKLINKFLPDMRHMDIEASDTRDITDDELGSAIRDIRKRIDEARSRTRAGKA